VDCHIGSGASSFVQYNLAGVRQLARLSTNSYQRPVPPAMDRMRPARETCEQCHLSGTSKEDLLKVIRHYDNDEKSTEKTTILLMRVGKVHKAHLDHDIEYTSLPSQILKKFQP
jgi:hypothetical protein